MQAQLLSDGKSTPQTPLLTDEKLLLLKLRDYSKADGIFVTNFNYTNTVKLSKKVVENNKNTLNQPNSIPNQMTNQVVTKTVQYNQSKPLQRKGKLKKKT